MNPTDELSVGFVYPVGICNLSNGLKGRIGTDNEK